MRKEREREKKREKESEREKDTKMNPYERIRVRSSKNIHRLLTYNSLGTLLSQNTLRCRWPKTDFSRNTTPPPPHPNFTLTFPYTYNT